MEKTMHNWWIAALEHAGLLTQEEATHISNEIRLGLHRENYDEAYRELEAILADKSKVVIDDAKRHEPGLLDELNKLEARVKALEDKAVTGAKKTVASKTKA